MRGIYSFNLEKQWWFPLSLSFTLYRKYQCGSPSNAQQKILWLHLDVGSLKFMPDFLKITRVYQPTTFYQGVQIQRKCKSNYVKPVTFSISYTFNQTYIVIIICCFETTYSDYEFIGGYVFAGGIRGQSVTFTNVWGGMVNPIHTQTGSSPRRPIFLHTVSFQ